MKEKSSMEYDYDSMANVVSIKFKIRTSKIEEFIVGCKDFCQTKGEGKGIEFNYKRKEKKNKIFYRIKISGAPKEIIFAIKQLDSMVQPKGMLWSDVIKRIKSDAVSNTKDN